jgi:hypothetical protein
MPVHFELFQNDSANRTAALLPPPVEHIDVHRPLEIPLRLKRGGPV